MEIYLKNFLNFKIIGIFFLLFSSCERNKKALFEYKNTVLTVEDFKQFSSNFFRKEYNLISKKEKINVFNNVYLRRTLKKIWLEENKHNIDSLSLETGTFRFLFKQHEKNVLRDSIYLSIESYLNSNSIELDVSHKKRQGLYEIASFEESNLSQKKKISTKKIIPPFQILIDAYHKGKSGSVKTLSKEVVYNIKKVTSDKDPLRKHLKRSLDYKYYHYLLSGLLDTYKLEINFQNLSNAHTSLTEKEPLFSIEGHPYTFKDILNKRNIELPKTQKISAFYNNLIKPFLLQKIYEHLFRDKGYYEKYQRELEYEKLSIYEENYNKTMFEKSSLNYFTSPEKALYMEEQFKQINAKLLRKFEGKYTQNTQLLF